MSYVHAHDTFIPGHGVRSLGELRTERAPFHALFAALVELTALRLAEQAERLNYVHDDTDVANELGTACSDLGIYCPDEYCMDTYGELLTAIRQKIGRDE